MFLSSMSWATGCPARRFWLVGGQRLAGSRPAIRQPRPVVLHVVIRPKTDPILDDQGGRIGNFELKSIVSAFLDERSQSSGP